MSTKRLARSLVTGGPCCVGRRCVRMAFSISIVNPQQSVRDLRISRHLHRIRLLVTQRSARFMVGFRRFVGAISLRSRDENRHAAIRGCPSARSGVRNAAKQALKYPPVHFDGRQALAISRGFAVAIAEHDYQVFACSILPDHVHLVVVRSDRPIERVVTHLKVKATAQLNAENRHPLCSFTDRRGLSPTPWGAKCWKCFLDDHRGIARAIRYVEENPTKEGKRRQQWPFVVPWDPV